MLSCSFEILKSDANRSIRFRSILGLKSSVIMQNLWGRFTKTQGVKLSGAEVVKGAYT